jgi:PAS domain S-box-containing protein
VNDLSADLLTAVVSSVADAIYVVDADGRVSFVNPAAVAILGYETAEQLIGRPSHATIHHSRPDGRPFPEQECPLLAPRLTGETVQRSEDWFIRQDGSFVPVSYSSAPVEIDQGRGAVVVFRDTTNHRAEELAASRARIVAATMEERRKLGRDLHDGAQQHLVNVSIALQLLAASDPEDQLLVQALDETKAAIADLREIAAGLIPTVLIHRGLLGAVETLTARTPLPVAISVPDTRYDPQLEAAAYFLISEALTNVAKHAQATRASVTVAAEGEMLVVTVSDDGRGGADPLRGSGLTGMADRIDAHDGELTVSSSAGTGTTVQARLPLSSPAAA